MAQQPKGAKKTGFLGSIGGAIDDVINEVKADVKAMTPPEQDKEAARRAAERAQQEKRIAELVSQSKTGLVEESVDGGSSSQAPQVQEEDSQVIGEEEREVEEEIRLHQKEKPKTVSLGMPTGNLWQVLRDPAVSARLRSDVCYHALTPADVRQYAEAVTEEKAGPFTLGIVAAGLPSMAGGDGADEGEDAKPPVDILTDALFKAIRRQPRLFGAVGAGPRNLWPSAEKLDDHLTAVLNENPKLIALGPLGLDEPFAPYTLPQQQEQFAVQLDIAADFQLPAFLTTRKSHAKMEQTLSAAPRLPRLVYLDPLATPEDIELVKRFNMYVVMRPELTQPNYPAAQAYKDIPISRLLLASGSALVAPHGFSGHFNQPRFLQNTLTAGAKIRGMREGDLLATANQNMVELFPQLRER